MRGAGAIFSAKSVHHCTPPAVLAPVRALAGGRIGLDPCSNPRSEVNARVEWRAGGLDRSWTGYGLVYVNPPYGRGVDEWVRRCADTAADGESVIALLPVRSETPWWQRDVARARCVCFWRGRIRFLGGKSCAPFPSAVVCWGDDLFGFQARAALGRYGWIP